MTREDEEKLIVERFRAACPSGMPNGYYNRLFRAGVDLGLELAISRPWYRCGHCGEDLSKVPVSGPGHVCQPKLPPTDFTR